MFPTPATPPVSYSEGPYVGQVRTYNYNSDRRWGCSQKSSGEGRGRGKPVPTATITKPGQVKEGQTAMSQSHRTPTNIRWIPAVKSHRPSEVDVIYRGEAKEIRNMMRACSPHNQRQSEGD